jgi:hypothetical protein
VHGLRELFESIVGPDGTNEHFEVQLEGQREGCSRRQATVRPF